MIIETLADIESEVYFINQEKIVKGEVEDIEVSVRKTTTIRYRIKVCGGKYLIYYSRDEDKVALTQKGLFIKIKLKEVEPNQEEIKEFPIEVTGEI